MDKLEFLRLWDLYGKLLTPTQQEITDLYFNLDLTVSEIAEQKGISRQGVSDCIGIAKRELEGYEQKLSHGKLMAESTRREKALLDKVCLWAENFLQRHPEYAEDINTLKDMAAADGRGQGE